MPLITITTKNKVTINSKMNIILILLRRRMIVKKMMMMVMVVVVLDVIENFCFVL